MNIYEFNKVIYKGNINRDFYLYCLKRNKKLIRYFFINVWYFVISIVFNNKKDLYTKNKYKYLKDIDDLNNIIISFYKEKNRYNCFLEGKKDIIIDKVPIIFIPKDLSVKIIGYELNDNYEVEIKKFEKQLSLIIDANKIYIRNKYELSEINSERIFIVNNNKIRFLNKRKKLNMKIIKLLVLIFISFFLTCLSFCYTNKSLDMAMYFSYFEPRLFLLNFIPIFLFVTLLYFVTKRVHVSFLLNSILILVFGVANQTKLLYRDDVIEFSDIMLLKEAMTMSERYDIVIKKYTILAIILIIIVFFILKRYISKRKIDIKKYFISILLILSIMFLSYKTLYKNEKIYNRVGDTSLINIWISTRQSQIRGLIYPFIYTIEDGFDKEPIGYNEEKAKKVLEEYNYEDIPDDKKVNIISIMLEAYNDFSKFDIFDFKEDIYGDFHDIQNKSISGNLVTTIFGGGTIVTERNFLTGYYNFPNFRAKTNSYVWYFKEQGYRTEAMHPIYGAFYNRASYNPNLGFDIYYNYENKFSEIQNDFLNDYDFFDYIIEGYELSSDNNIPYFNFSVTYQNHGPYFSGEYEEKEYFIENTGYDIEAYNTINEYFSGIKKTNVALKKLVYYFENENEPVILILFGDHNPYLGDNGYSEFNINLDLSSIDGFENYYETPYLIYANNSAKKIFNKDFIGEGNTISPIFLMNELFDYCGLKGNEYLQYMSNLKSNIDVISDYYYKENGEFVEKDQSKYGDLIEEYRYINYYYSRNFKGGIK